MALLAVVVCAVVLIGLALIVGGVEKHSLEHAYRNLAVQRRRFDDERRRLLAWENDLAEWERDLDGRAGPGNVPPLH